MTGLIVLFTTICIYSVSYSHYSYTCISLVSVQSLVTSTVACMWALCFHLIHVCILHSLRGHKMKGSMCSTCRYMYIHCNCAHSVHSLSLLTLHCIISCMSCISNILCELSKYNTNIARVTNGMASEGVQRTTSQAIN